MDRRSIGIMDSGIGGLTVVKVLQRQLPHESLVFVGDQARLPYGVRPMTQIQQFCLQIAHFLQTYDIKLMIIACNTATAAALDYLKDQLPVPVIGVISPGSQAVVQLPVHKTVGVIATEQTIRSGAYTAQIHALDPTVEVRGLACQEFVTLVEHNQMGTTTAQEMVTRKMQVFNEHPVDALIYGCTHFPLLENEIRRALQYSIPLVDAGAATAEYVKRKLIEFDGLSDAPHAQNRYFTTGDPSEFHQVASQWLGDSMLDISNIKVGD